MKGIYESGSRLQRLWRAVVTQQDFQKCTAFLIHSCARVESWEFGIVLQLMSSYFIYLLHYWILIKWAYSLNKILQASGCKNASQDDPDSLTAEMGLYSDLKCSTALLGGSNNRGPLALGAPQILVNITQLSNHQNHPVLKFHRSILAKVKKNREKHHKLIQPKLPCFCLTCFRLPVSVFSCSCRPPTD